MRVNETALYAHIKGHLKARREEMGLTQGQLAARLGLERTSVTNIELGRQKPPLHVIYALCHELALDVSELLPPVGRVMMADVGRDIEVAGQTLPPLAAAFVNRQINKGGL